MWTEVRNQAGSISSNPIVSAQDHGLLVGDGIFETLQTQAGTILSLDRHLDRMRRSAAIVGFPEVPESSISDALQNLRKNADFQEVAGRLRITLTSGVGALGSNRSDDWTLIISWVNSAAWPAFANVQISNVTRYSKSILAGAKTTSYMENVIALQNAKAAGFDEAILLNENGHISEGTGSNIFFIKDREIFTPPLSSGALGGITRELLMDTVPAIKELQLVPADVARMDAAFLTSSTRDLQPIKMFGEHEFEYPNALFDKIRKLYQVAADLERK